MSSPRKVPDTTVRRLSFYLRILRQLRAGGTRTVSSGRLAEIGGLTSAQVRKDLSRFGNFGVRGLGYDVEALERHVGRILGLDRPWKAIVVGAGRLGSALTAYPGFEADGFRIVAALDNDPARIGARVGGVDVRPVAELEEIARRERVSIGLIATPAAAAQSAADRLVSAGVRGILNFAPTALEVPPGVAVRDVNLAIELEGLSYAITGAGGAPEGGSD